MATAKRKHGSWVGLLIFPNKSLFGRVGLLPFDGNHICSVSTNWR